MPSRRAAMLTLPQRRHRVRLVQTGSEGNVPGGRPTQSAGDLPHGSLDHLRSRSALSPSFISPPAASKCRRLLQSNAMDERVGMTMHQLPFRVVLAVDLRYAERPVLVRQAANLGLLPLDHDENYERV